MESNTIHKIVMSIITFIVICLVINSCVSEESSVSVSEVEDSSSNTTNIELAVKSNIEPTIKSDDELTDEEWKIKQTKTTIELTDSIKIFDIDNLKNPDEIMVYINGLNDLSKDAYILSGLKDDLGDAGRALQQTIKERQLAAYPTLRKRWYNMLLKDVMEEHGVRVSISGKRNTVLTFKGNRYSSISGFMTHDIYSDVFEKLRFKTARYNWTGSTRTVRINSPYDADVRNYVAR